jgi:hypothetical protein
LKISHLFSLNQYCKILLLIGLTCLSGKAFSEDESQTPGIIESFERLLDLQKNQYKDSKQSIQSILKKVSDLSDFTEIKLDPQFMKSILLHSDERYLKLAQKDECLFLSTLESNLFKTSDGLIENILITYKEKNNSLGSTSMFKDDFFEQIYKKKCLNNREYSILFNPTNIKKTIEGIKFSIPKNKSQCYTILEEWLINPFTPYLCRIEQGLKNSLTKKQVESYTNEIPLVNRIYISNLCKAITNPDAFCTNYLKNDVWNKILNSEFPEYKMSYKCQQLLNKKEKLTNLELRNCASKLVTDVKFCETRGNKDYPSNFPLQSCDNISLALNNSKLITDYHDCPGNVDNEALTNIHRIVNHFSPRKIISSRENCSGEASYSLAKLNLEIKNTAVWPLKICYLNRAQNKEVCTIYIPGSRTDETLSEDQVVAKILYTQKGANQKTTCRIVDSKTYDPQRSEYKFGCFIVYNTDTCTAISCQKKVIWEEKEQTDIKFVGVPVFDYFPTNYSNERFSFLGLMSDVKRTLDRPIKNLTDLKFHLSKIENGIVHGIGCAEDLSPEQFQRISINQCHPLPFIIDGHLEKNNETLLVTRLSIDDIHSPRLIRWPNVFNSVSSYQELQPLNTWTLNGIKK